MRTIRVVVVVPKGLDGQGGIERLFLYVRKSPVPGLEFRFLTSRGGGSALSGLWTYMKSLSLLLAWLIRRDIDILHVNLSVGGSVYRKSVIIALARAFSVPTVIHYHGGGFDRMYTDTTPWIRLTGMLLRKASLVIALGERWRDIFTELGVDPRRIVVVYNGVPDFAPALVRSLRPEGPLRLCFAGEVGQRKGVHILVESLILLKDEDWTCIIAGNGDVTSYRETLARHGLGDRVTFTGWIDSDGIHRILCDSDVVVLPSRGEALPVALIEGAAASTALIASAAGASAEIVRHRVGGIVVPLDPTALADAIRELARDRHLLLSMQNAARRHYNEQFRQEIMEDKLKNIYLDLVDGNYN
jgi:glycosyltransferase involved in cell wall biosynthesis